MPDELDDDDAGVLDAAGVELVEEDEEDPPPQPAKASAAVTSRASVSFAIFIALTPSIVGSAKTSRLPKRRSCSQILPHAGPLPNPGCGSPSSATSSCPVKRPIALAAGGTPSAARGSTSRGSSSS